MRLTLNLASDPFVDMRPLLRRLRIAMYSLAISSLVLGGILYVLRRHEQGAYVRARSVESNIADAGREIEGLNALVRRPDNAKVIDETEALNQLFDEKAFSWTVVMRDLETVLPQDVQLTTIEPVRAKSGDVILHFHVLGPRNGSLEFLQNLEYSKRFGIPRIVGETAKSEGGPNDKLPPFTESSVEEFDLLAAYDPLASGATATLVPVAAEVPNPMDTRSPRGSNGNAAGIARARSTATPESDGSGGGK
jgi:type IV pilus assembly protein PilN